MTELEITIEDLNDALESTSNALLQKQEVHAAAEQEIESLRQRVEQVTREQVQQVERHRETIQKMEAAMQMMQEQLIEDDADSEKMELELECSRLRGTVARHQTEASAAMALAQAAWSDRL